MLTKIWTAKQKKDALLDRTIWRWKNTVKTEFEEII
jgi:hypothetical protein